MNANWISSEIQHGIEGKDRSVRCVREHRVNAGMIAQYHTRSMKRQMNSGVEG